MIKIYSVLHSVLIFLLLTQFLAPQASALMVRKNIEELTFQADSILIGKVQKIESRWNEEKTLIYTYVTISVSQYTKALSSAKQFEEIIVRVRGGEVGDVGLRVSDTPEFREGEEVFLFLKKESLPLFSVTGLFQGKYTIEGGIARNNMLGVEIPLDDFVSQIKNSMEKAAGSE